jgi:hypothetical protein
MTRATHYNDRDNNTRHRGLHPLNRSDRSHLQRLSRLVHLSLPLVLRLACGLQIWVSSLDLQARVTKTLHRIHKRNRTPVRHGISLARDLHDNGETLFSDTVIWNIRLGTVSFFSSVQHRHLAL